MTQLVGKPNMVRPIVGAPPRRRPKLAECNHLWVFCPTRLDISRVRVVENINPGNQHTQQVTRSFIRFSIVLISSRASYRAQQSFPLQRLTGT
jgi:hypothetical protein